ncbi:MAG TPA: hypothetical protein VNV63_05870 [Nitrospiria bacterium]|nr:hypothetical protein [Nitrospiria bacterium]
MMTGEKLVAAQAAMKARPKRKRNRRYCVPGRKRLELLNMRALTPEEKIQWYRENDPRCQMVKPHE